MIHPNTTIKFISDEIGHGVVATKRIPAGTITWVFDPLDRELTSIEVISLKPVCKNIMETYTYRNRNGNYILCWDHGKYLNHSFTPNCMATAYNFEVAINDIEEGEELTNDYGCLNIIQPFRAANEGTKRKTVYPDDLLRYYKQWDDKLKKVFPELLRLPQPLKPLLSDEKWAIIEQIISDDLPMDSILNNFFDEKV